MLRDFIQKILIAYFVCTMRSTRPVLVCIFLLIVIFFFYDSHIKPSVTPLHPIIEKVRNHPIVEKVNDFFFEDEYCKFVAFILANFNAKLRLQFFQSSRPIF